MDRAGGWLVNAGEQVEDRRLACAVRTDETEDLAFLHGHVELVDRAEPAETDRRLVSLQYEVGTVRAHRGFSPPTEVSLCVAELAVPLGPSVSLRKRLRNPLNASEEPSSPCGRVIIRMISSSE